MINNKIRFKFVTFYKENYIRHVFYDINSVLQDINGNYIVKNYMDEEYIVLKENFDRCVLTEYKSLCDINLDTLFSYN